MGERNILLVMGGTSAEREVSLASGAACARALSALGYRYRCCDFRGELDDLVEALRQDHTLMLNCLHGTLGEDGRVQALGDLLGIPYTHSGVRASAVAMHKRMSRDIFCAHGLAVAESVCLDEAEVAALEDWPRVLPLVVKPVGEGSSIGVQIYEAESSFAEARTEIVQLTRHGALLFEAYIPGRELTVAVAQDGDELVTLGITELLVRSGFYDYRAKYDSALGAPHVCPAEVPGSLRRRLSDTAIAAHRALDLRGVSRADFRYDPWQDRLVLLEVNTQPGMTETSLLPEQAASYGWDFPMLVDKILEAATHD